MRLLPPHLSEFEGRPFVLSMHFIVFGCYDDDHQMPTSKQREMRIAKPPVSLPLHDQPQIYYRPALTIIYSHLGMTFAHAIAY